MKTREQNLVDAKWNVKHYTDQVEKNELELRKSIVWLKHLEDENRN